MKAVEDVFFEVRLSIADKSSDSNEPWPCAGETMAFEGANRNPPALRDLVLIQKFCHLILLRK